MPRSSAARVLFPAALGEHERGVAAPELVEGRAEAGRERQAARGLRGGAAAEPVGQVAGDDDAGRVQGERARDHVLELAHVARPVVGLQERARLGRDRRALAAPVLRREVLGEERHVLAPVAQRRDPDRDDVEPVVEVLAELAGLHRRLEVAVRRGDHPRVHRDRLVRADAPDRPLLQRAQQARLEPGPDVADLVEEERAARRLLEEAAARGLRAGERAARVAEQLGLEHALGDRAAVHRDERPGGARRRLVERAGDQLLAGARTRRG